MKIKERIELIEKELKSDIEKVKIAGEIETIRIKYLGKKSEIQNIFIYMKDLEASEKSEIGGLVNGLKKSAGSLIEEKRYELELSELNEKLSNEKIDITLPGVTFPVGGPHPVSKTIDELENLFMSMGYDVIEGPEIESDLYNFEMLNLPKGHPARDMQDTFYITEEILLRSQTSPVQIRAMLANENKGPIRIICPGKTYRRDNDDATHTHQFTQFEGLVIDEGISLADLKGTLDIFAKKFFGETKTRFRPSYYPFTEPSIEYDVECPKCNGVGCDICKTTGWLTIMGAGMVHPNVLKMSGYNPEKYTGFAFGMGVEKIPMLKYGITDLRNLYSKDLRTIKQFNRTEGREQNGN